MKNDRRDARALSEASCRMLVPSVHIASRQARDCKALCGMRDALVRSRTQLVNTVRGWLRTNLVRPRSGGVETLPRRVRDACKDVPGFVERQLLTIEMLSDQIADADRELAEVAKNSTVCRRLMTIPGVGPLTAVRFEATVDDPKRFRSGHALMSYLGLTPGENSSGDKKRTTGITKAGCSRLRWQLMQCVWTFLRLRPNDRAAQWAESVMKRRGRKVGAVAMARKLAGIMFALWRKDRTYHPNPKPYPTMPLATAQEVLAEARQ